MTLTVKKAVINLLFVIAEKAPPNEKELNTHQISEI